MDKEDVEWLIGLLVDILLVLWQSKKKEPKKRKRRKRK